MVEDKYTPAFNLSCVDHFSHTINEKVVQCYAQFIDKTYDRENTFHSFISCGKEGRL